MQNFLQFCIVTTPFKESHTKEQALQKLKHYCAYQERCHQEVTEKLYSLGMHKKEVGEIIAQLIEENYLNEERYAFQYAGSKFRMKKWGRVKIQFALKQKQVSEYCIKKALGQIDDEEYFKTLGKLAEEKRALLKNEKNGFIRMRKLQDYLLQKGYEFDLIRDFVSP